MEISLPLFNKIIVFTASALLFFPSVSTSITHTPGLAVNNALTGSFNPCSRLQNSASLSADETRMLDLCKEISEENNTGDTQTRPAFKALSPRAISSVTRYTANGFYSLNINDITKRLASLRKSSMKHSTKITSLWDKNPFIVSSKYAGNQLTGGGASADELGGVTDNRLSGFLTGDFVNIEQNETSTLAAYKTGVKAIFVGLDYRFTQKIFAGIAAKSLTGDVDLIGDVGTVDISDTSLSLYGNYNYSEHLYFQSTLTTGKGTFDITRRINFEINNTLFNETANSKPKGDGFGFSLSSGYDTTLANSGLSSVFDVSLNYTRTDIDAFIETGAQGFNLQVGRQSIESLSTKANMQINKAISTSYGVIIPEVSASWTHQFITEGEDIITTFDVDPNNPFSYTTDKIESDFFTLSLATSVVLPHGIMGFIQYETLIGIDGYTVNAFNVGARIEF